MRKPWQGKGRPPKGIGSLYDGPEGDFLFFWRIDNDKCVVCGEQPTRYLGSVRGANERHGGTYCDYCRPSGPYCDYSKEAQPAPTEEALRSSRKRRWSELSGVHASQLPPIANYGDDT